MRVLVLVAAWLAAGAACGAAQDSLARLAGTVASSKNGRPLAGVMVAVKGTRGFHVTDSTGTFAIAQLPPGRHVLRLSVGDRVSEDYQIALAPAQTLEIAILLDVGSVELDPIVIEATSASLPLSLAGFYARRDKGFGRFVTGDDIERRSPATLSAMLAGTGVVMRCNRANCIPVRVQSGRRCPVAVFVDGMRVDDYNIDGIPPENVLGIEVYRGAAETPAAFSRHSSPCGAILIWTKI